MVSEHEYCHVELNVVTSFGALLLVVGAESPVASAQQRLVDLVGSCRGTHEVFATCLGAWRTCQDPDETVRPYTGYPAFLQTGRRLSKQFSDGSLPAGVIVTGACHAAMSPPLTSLLGGGASSLAADRSPDRRLDALIDAELDFAWLREEIDDAIVIRRAVDCLEEICALPEPLYAALVSRVYAQCAEHLRTVGHDTQPEHAHMADRRVIEVLLRSPEGRAFVGADATTGPTGAQWRLSLADGERWSGPLAGSDAVVGQLADVSRSEDAAWQLEHFLWPVAGMSHVLVVVRPLDVLLEQYALSAQSEGMLRHMAINDVVVAARRVVRADDAYTLLAALRAPSELDRLAAVTADLHVVASVSESCLRAGALAAEWVEELGRRTYLTLLGDVPRSAWVRSLGASETGPLRYGVAEFERERTDGHRSDGDEDLASTEALIVAGVDHAMGSLVFGSPNLTKALRQVLEATAGIELTYDHDLTVESAEMQAILIRLADEEPWFATRELTSAAEPAGDAT